MSVIDPITEAEEGVTALKAFEQLAVETKDGTITVNTRAGQITSIVVTRVLKPDDFAAAAPLAAIVDDLRWGGVEFEVISERIVDWAALPRRRIA